MNLERAIEIATANTQRDNLYYPPDLQVAFKLCIEALKRLENMRLSPCTTADELLPEETE